MQIPGPDTHLEGFQLLFQGLVVGVRDWMLRNQQILFSFPARSLGLDETQFHRVPSSPLIGPLLLVKRKFVIALRGK